MEMVIRVPGAARDQVEVELRRSGIEFELSNTSGFDAVQAVGLANVHVAPPVVLRPIDGTTKTDR